MTNINPTDLMTPRELREYRLQEKAPSPYQTYTYAEWKKLGDPEPKNIKPQSAFERDYDKIPEPIKKYITDDFALPDEEDAK